MRGLAHTRPLLPCSLAPATPVLALTAQPPSAYTLHLQGLLVSLHPPFLQAGFSDTGGSTSKLSLATYYSLLKLLSTAPPQATPVRAALGW